MTIAELLRGLRINRERGPLDMHVKGIAYDSRCVKKEFLFVAVRGFSADGHTYIKEAINRGCVGVVAEKAVQIPDDIAYIEVSDSRKALARLSASFYGMPSDELSLIGITGTNGKTTTSFIVKSILEAGGRSAGLLGTIQYSINKKLLKASHTTPESLDLQKYLREMVESGIEYAVLEVSSHALALQRVEGCSFQGVAFTNFTRDHLDFHGTMDEYFRTKRLIFRHLREGGFAVLNRDDPKVRSISQEVRGNVITCGLQEGALVTARDISESREAGMEGGLSFIIETPEGEFPVVSSLIGKNNVYNILMSAAIAYALDISSDEIIRGIRRSGSIEGRFEKIDEGQDFLCIIDYAHTEEALRNLIAAAREITKERIITVFGCGGDRDRGKRPIMGAAAAELSDFVVVTSDNPRSEDPLKIIQDITGGMSRTSFTVLPDRQEAIREGVRLTGKGDTLLIAGKGHEDYQEILGVRYPFSDKEVVRKIIREAKKKKDSRDQEV
jgi:UDP-N-acetylmuramoyl-L-alanyl-D-glutamate--2,6-diaminopimelate ligase